MNMRHRISLIAVGLLVFVSQGFVSQGFAQTGGKETKVMIRAIARDAKVLGEHVGGARITVKDASTGKILAEGMQRAGTGDTDLIMKKPRVRGATVFGTPDASGFLAVLTLDKPTVVEVTAEGPLGTPQATQRASTTMLLVPGQDVLGEGVLLELHGFIVKTLAPSMDTQAKTGSPFEVKATVTMMCGCPIEAGGMWDANKIHVVARLVSEGKIETEVPMEYAGVTNTFKGSVPVSNPGQVELQVLAMDADNSNFGLASQNLTILP
ncbi:MAG: hypothetical protein LAO19_12545 [Acidobacteriia bacterium]|nr:hypothetical protein [Terriglobia bacterium]